VVVGIVWLRGNDCVHVYSDALGGPAAHYSPKAVLVVAFADDLQIVLSRVHQVPVEVSDRV
jgi:hypothetical protein